MDTRKTNQNDSLMEEIVGEVKKRLEKLQAEAPNFGEPEISRRKTVLLLGQPEESGEMVLRTFFRIITSPDEGEWDLVVAARIPPCLMAYVAQGIPGTPKARWILGSMLEGKKVYFLESGLEYRKYRDSSIKTLFQKYQEYEGEIRHLGVQIVQDAGIVGEREVSSRQITEGKNAECFLPEEGTAYDMTGLKLLRESDLGKIRGLGCRTVYIDKKTIITPLAQDYISNHNLAVRRRQ